MRRLVPVAILCASVLALVATPADAAAPPLRTSFAPVNAQIVKIGDDIGTSIGAADKETDTQLAKQFAGLATRTSAASIKVSKLQGATGPLAADQRKLQLSLAKVASDLAGIYRAAMLHSAPKAKAATIALIKDSTPVKSARIALAHALGIKASG
jgi:hypothetical protein